MPSNSRQALGLAVGGLFFIAGTASPSVLVRPRPTLAPVTLPGISGSMAVPGLLPGTFFSGQAMPLAAPSSVVPVERVELQPEKPVLSVKVAELKEGFADIAASPAMKADAQPADAHGAGKVLEHLLTGQEDAPAPAATQEELSFAAQASLRFGLAADDVGAERGLKAGAVLGQDFLAMLAEAHRRLSETGAGPSPKARESARTVREQVIRVVRALIKQDEPLGPRIRRILSVWQVFNQEMEGAAAKGSLEAIEAEARLFADQVEQSV
ncbi:MAG: hypothetical protein HZB91_12675 [Elusimicrobia bacterium]|nr:hypothetical protein [Elusimicrobiota bacterium]